MPAQSDRPRIRPVEAFPAGDDDGQELFVVYDPSGLAEGAMTLSRAALFVLSLMDGTRDLGQIEETFAAQTGQRLPSDQLAGMVEQLDQAHYLDSPAFAAHVQSLIDAYRACPERVSADPETLGAGPDGLAATITEMLARRETPPADRSRRLVGLIAPHLDFARGAPGYANAYGAVADAQPPQRVIILGTNHFGFSPGPVATSKDFRTPLGLTRADHAFIEALSERVGGTLCEHEYDHQREHSIELQVLILQHLLGPDAFSIVPVLCHDPCGPTGTKPYNGEGADLRDLAEAIGDLARADSTPTLIVAGADFSHVGPRFGDDRHLDDAFLGEVEQRDRAALTALVQSGRDAFVEQVTAHENGTRICSVGCMYALLTALPHARKDLLSYHQSSDPDSGTCVTSAAIALWSE